jgi:uncharacterized damage-inducible protein DinB
VPGRRRTCFSRSSATSTRVLLRKLAGLSEEDLRRAPTASSLSLLGLLKHSAHTHRWWFRRVFAGEDVPFLWEMGEDGELLTDPDPDADFRPELDETAEDIAALYLDEVERCRAIVAAASLDDPSRAPRPGQESTLRGITLHMIQETARHLGQADIIRESIDGATGD